MATSFASATDYTFTPSAVSGESDPYTYTFSASPTVEGFSFTAKKNSGSTAPTYNTKASDVRIYAGGTFTISIPQTMKVTAVTFNISTQGQKRLAPITVDKGTIAKQAWEDTQVKWTGDATGSITFTVGAKNDYGTEGNTTAPDAGKGAKAGQLDFSSIVISAESALSGNQKPAGLAFGQSSYTVPFGSAFESPVLENPNKLTVTWASSDETVATVNNGTVSILKAGTTTISAKSEASDDFAAGNASYTLNVVDAANSIAEMIEKAANINDKIYVNCNLFVTYVNGSYVYVNDIFENATLLYGTNSYKVGDCIPYGWEATNATFNGLLEFKGNFPAATGSEFPPYYETVKTVTEADVNKVLYIDHITFAAATPNTTKTIFSGVTADGETLTFRTNWNVESVAAGEYKVLGAVGIYEKNGERTLQIYPISYTEAVQESEVPAYPEYLTVTCDATDVTVSNNNDYGMPATEISCKTTNNYVTVTFAIPEGWDALYHDPVVKDDSGISQDPLAPSAETAEWVSTAEFVQYGFVEGNTVEIPAVENPTGYEEPVELQVYLAHKGQVDANNRYLVLVTAVKDTNSAVEEVEVADADAVYYNLQGVEVENPVNGVYVKVANGKATKVVVK